jgi:hypothetical protein
MQSGAPTRHQIGLQIVAKEADEPHAIVCVPSNHGSNREAESTDAPERGGLPRSILKRGNARGAKGVGHRL